MCNKLI